MQSGVVVTGTLTDEKTVVLDEPLALGQVRVRLCIEPLAHAPRSHQEVMAAIRERQRRRGFQPPTREEVDVGLCSERESWGDA